MIDISFPKPRYEVRAQGDAGMFYVVWDTVRGYAVYESGSRFERDAQRAAAILNREYQRWLTDRFYDRAGAEKA
jgi:hypothetical protein